MILKPFAREEDASKQRAAAEATPISIPFRSPTHLELSGGATDTCFFLQSKATKEIFPWNAVMAEYGNVHFLPVYDPELLKRPEFAGEVAVWKAQGALSGGKKQDNKLARFADPVVTDVEVKPTAVSEEAEEAEEAEAPKAPKAPVKVAAKRPASVQDFD